MKSRQLRRSTVCLNCGSALSGNFCSDCGQENTDYRVSLGRLLRDLAEEVLSIESRLWRSLWHLVRHPGRLTRDYNFGRRVRYTSPLRLYLFCSIAYFFVGAIAPQPSTVTLDITETPSGPLPDSAIGRRVREHVVAFQKAGLEEKQRRITQIVVTVWPKMMVLLLPLFALLLMGFFRRRLYVEHLVFALHAHALLFGIGTLAELTRSQAIQGGTFLLAPLLWTPVALHTVYEQSWPRTLWKTLTVGLLYLVIGGAVMTALLSVALFLW
jgi:hypothetical protein